LYLIGFYYKLLKKPLLIDLSVFAKAKDAI